MPEEQNHRAREKWILTGILVMLLVIVFSSLFSVFRMPDNSMESAVIGQKTRGPKRGQLVLALRWIRMDSLTMGDLVVVKIATNSTPLRVVRRIQSIEPANQATGTRTRGGGRSGAIGRTIAEKIREMDAQPRLVLSAEDGSSQCEVQANQIAGKVMGFFSLPGLRQEQTSGSSGTIIEKH